MTPPFTVYNPQGEYIAACKYSEDAAALVRRQGEGATIRYRHKRTVWTHGAEPNDDGRDDTAAIIMHRRLEKAYPKAFGSTPGES